MEKYFYLKSKKFKYLKHGHVRQYEFTRFMADDVYMLKLALFPLDLSVELTMYF